MQGPDNPYLATSPAWIALAVGQVQVGLDHLASELQHQLAEAWDRGQHEGYEQGSRAGAAATEARLKLAFAGELREALEKQAREVEGRLQRQFDRLRQEAVEEACRDQAKTLRRQFATELDQAVARARQDEEGRLRPGFERESAERAEEAVGRTRARLEIERDQALRQLREDLAREHAAELERQADAHSRMSVVAEEPSSRKGRRAKGTGELPGDAAQLEAYQRGAREASVRAALEREAAFEEGLRKGRQETGGVARPGGSSVLLDEAKRQAYQNGYEDGRSVGLAQGRRDAEALSNQKLRDASHGAFQEGYREGRKGTDGDRNWAYGILHLPLTATSSEVKQRYKRLSLLLHPDQHPGLEDEYIKNLNRARELLGG